MGCTSAAPTVFVVDDNRSVRESIEWLFGSLSMNVVTFDSAEQFSASDFGTRYGCLILDVRMPDVSGLQLLDMLVAEKFPLPVILISGYGTAQMGAQAIKKGAFDFLQKPYRDQDLLDSVNAALRLRRDALAVQSERAKYHHWLDSLTQRESETLELVVAGKSNNEIARVLGISLKTVEAHRGRLMRKLGVRSTNDPLRRAIMNNGHCRNCQWLSLPKDRRFSTDMTGEERASSPHQAAQNGV